jgi:hypothetical protein
MSPPINTRGLLFASGPTVPANGTDGYQPGCLFLHTDGSAGGVLYVNEGSVTLCDFNAVASGTALVLDGSGTTGIAVSGTYERVMDVNHTVGSETDGVVLRVGEGIGTNALAMPDGGRGLAIYLRNITASGTLTGVRLRCVNDPDSGASSSDALLVQSSVVASKNATTVNSGFFEFIPKGTNVIGTARALLCNVDSAASVTYTTLIGHHIRFHTRGDETVTNDYMLYIENEAVGGNGREVEAAIKIGDTNISGGVIGYTAGIVASGSFQRVFDIQPTLGSSTDGVIMRVGAGIGANALAMPNGGRGFALYFRNVTASGTLTGVRLRTVNDPASGASSSDSLLCQASVVASKNATTINAGFFEVIQKGTNVIATNRVLLCNLDSAASVTVTDQIIAHFRVHTRGDETITNDEMLRLENEAVGGNGRQLDSYIRCVPTNISGGITSAAYLIDGGTSTTLLGTAVLRVPDDGTVCHDTDSGPAASLDKNDLSGYITVVVGTATRYIPLLAAKPSAV